MSTRRLRWTLNPDATSAVLDGDIDEFADLPRLAEELKGPRLELDLAGVRRINSLGLRSWIHWIQLLAGRSLTFLRCSPAIVEQLSSIKGFRGHAVIKTVLLPYTCESCGTRLQPEIELASLRGATELPPPPTCRTCRQPYVLDDFPERYLGLAKFESGAAS